jgi:hypothetical protein
MNNYYHHLDVFCASAQLLFEVWKFLMMVCCIALYCPKEQFETWPAFTQFLCCYPATIWNMANICNFCSTQLQFEIWPTFTVPVLVPSFSLRYGQLSQLCANAQLQSETWPAITIVSIIQDQPSCLIRYREDHVLFVWQTAAMQVVSTVVPAVIAVADNTVMPWFIIFVCSVSAYLSQPFCAVQHGSCEVYHWRAYVFSASVFETWVCQKMSQKVSA